MPENQEDNLKQPNNKNNKNNNTGGTRLAIFIFIFLVIVVGILLYYNQKGAGTSIPYSSFITLVQQGDVKSVKIVNNRSIEGVYLDPRAGKDVHFKTAIPYLDNTLIPTLQSKGVVVSGGSSQYSLFQIFLNLLPWVIILFVFYIVYKRSQSGLRGAMSFGKNNAKKYVEKKEKVTFADVAGQVESKYELEEIVSFLKEPQKYIEIGAHLPRGVLLVGQPGTGKTLLARAVAGEAGVSFLHISGSEFVEMFVGVGASRVRNLFEQARKESPSIVFIDELDAVGRSRGAGLGGGNDEREQTLNQMLVEMDGFEVNETVIVMAATNRPDVLDPALLRPGRFDRQIVVDMPDVQERGEILKIHTKKIKVQESHLDYNLLAKATPGFSGAQLANMVNEAALYAARRNSKEVQMRDFEEARDKVMMGVARRNRMLGEKERLATARHEAGHAILFYLLPHMSRLHKVTIVPRGMALGMAVSLDENKYSYTKSELLQQIKMMYGGFCAEELFYKETTTGVKNDLEKATQWARRMVLEFGMTELGPYYLGESSSDHPVFLGKEIGHNREYSESTASKVDQMVLQILNGCLHEVRQLFQENKDKISLLAETLLEKETLSDKDIRQLLDFPLSQDSSEVDKDNDLSKNQSVQNPSLSEMQQEKKEKTEIDSSKSVLENKKEHPEQD